MKAVSRVFVFLQVIIGVIYMCQAITVWCGHKPWEFNAAGTMVCGMAAVELGVLKLWGKV